MQCLCVCVCEYVCGLCMALSVCTQVFLCPMSMGLSWINQSHPCSCSMTDRMVAARAAAKIVEGDGEAWERELSKRSSVVA